MLTNFHPENWRNKHQVQLRTRDGRQAISYPKLQLELLLDYLHIFLVLKGLIYEPQIYLIWKKERFDGQQSKRCIFDVKRRMPENESNQIFPVFYTNHIQGHLAWFISTFHKYNLIHLPCIHEVFIYPCCWYRLKELEFFFSYIDSRVI